MGRPGLDRGRPPAGEAQAGWAWRSCEAERCNERRRLDLWGCARGPGLPARASIWEHKQVLAQEWRDWVLTRPANYWKALAGSLACGGAELGTGSYVSLDFARFLTLHPGGRPRHVYLAVWH